MQSHGITINQGTYTELFRTVYCHQNDILLRYYYQTFLHSGLIPTSHLYAMIDKVCTKLQTKLP